MPGRLSNEVHSLLTGRKLRSGLAVLRLLTYLSIDEMGHTAQCQQLSYGGFELLRLRSAAIPASCGSVHQLLHCRGWRQQKLRLWFLNLLDA